MKVFAVIAICLLMVSCAWAAPSVQDNQIESESTFTRTARYLGSCFESDDMTTCLAVKGITALNRAARSNNFELINGVSFKRNSLNPVQRAGRALNEADVLAQLPENAEDRTVQLIDMAAESAADFLGSHNLEVKVPAETTQEIARALDEGRGKLKKMMGPLILAIGAKFFALIPLLLGGLTLLAAKAAIIAKIALIVAVIVAVSRFFGGFSNRLNGALTGGYNANSAWSGASNGGGGWSSGASSAYPYARSIPDSNSDAQVLAYAGQTHA